MSSLHRTIGRGMMFKGMNAKQKKIRRHEREEAREAKRKNKAVK